MNGLHSHMIGVTKGGKKLEAKGIEKRTPEKSESLSMTTGMTENHETAGTGETLETAGSLETPETCGTPER